MNGGNKYMINKGMMTSNTPEWATPQAFFDELDKEFHFDLDPCANTKNHKCAMWFSEEEDGLSKSWNNSRVFCNPPYGRVLKDWVKKASEARGGIVVLLVPARTDTRYFHEYIYQKPNVEIRFLKGRLKFGDGKGSAPFPSMVVIFR